MSFSAQFPEEHELIWLFESEPHLLDSDVPWCYNTITFKTVRGEDSVWCSISPAYSNLDFTWTRNGVEVARLNLSWIEGLEVKYENSRELLKVTFQEETLLAPLYIQMKPQISIALEMNLKMGE